MAVNVLICFIFHPLIILVKSINKQNMHLNFIMYFIYNMFTICAFFGCLYTSQS